MEAIIFCGIQASGKTTFYQERFVQTHLRLSLDMLRTRRREWKLVQACLAAGQRFVVDNTNPTAGERARYIIPAKAAHFRVVGYFFDTPLHEALQRNGLRVGKQRIPVAGIQGCFQRLEPPRYEEGFDRLYRVRPAPAGFAVGEIACPDAGNDLPSESLS